MIELLSTNNKRKDKATRPQKATHAEDTIQVCTIRCPQIFSVHRVSNNVWCLYFDANAFTASVYSSVQLAPRATIHQIVSRRSDQYRYEFQAHNSIRKNPPVPNIINENKCSAFKEFRYLERQPVRPWQRRLCTVSGPSHDSGNLLEVFDTEKKLRSVSFHQ